MDSSSATDESLMAQAAGGSREAMNVLLRRYASPLLTFLQRMVGDRSRAEELFQEVFLAVWRQRRDYRHPLRFRSWLFGIAANQGRAAFRKHVPEPVDMDGDCGLVLASAEPEPVEAAICAERATLVAQAVAQLPAGPRTVLVLREWNGLSYAEIAEAMGRTEATVRSHMFHALTALRKYLEPRLH